MKLKSVVMMPPMFFGGEGDGDGSVDSVVNSDSFLSGDAEVQDASDQDWDNDSGNQDQSGKTKREQSDTDEDQDGEEAEETDSSDEDEESQDEESEEAKFELPTEIAKAYPKSVMAHFAKRLGATLDDLAGNQPLQKAVKQLVDNAINDVGQKARLSELEAEDEEEQEEEAVEVAKTEPVKTPEEQFKAYDQQLTDYAKRVNDPQMVDALVRARAASWGVNPDDPKQMEALKAKGVDLVKGVEADTKAAINLVNTMAPQFMAQWLEASFPGFGKMYEGALHSQITEEVRNSKEFSAKGLPEYGTPEFNQKIGEVLKTNPWIDKMVFTKVVNGQKVPVSQREQISEKYKVAFGLMSGEKPNSAAVEQALETGRREERKKAAKTKTATNLGAGKTSGNFGKSETKLKGSGLGVVEEYEKRKGDGF